MQERRTIRQEKKFESAGLIWKLKEYKKQEKCSWDEIARKLTISRQTVLRWIKNGMISDSYRRILLDFFRELEESTPYFRKKGKKTSDSY